MVIGGHGKYHVASQADRTMYGQVFASKREMQIAQTYMTLFKTGGILELEYQPRIELIPKPNRIVYVPDFRIVWKNGDEEYVDVKGMETDVFKMKQKMFHHFFPTKKLTIVR